MKNDGWTDLEYELCDDAETNQRLSKLINESCHVFRAHADGNWNSFYKPKYAEKYADEIKARPYLTRKLLDLGDRVVSNLTYAAIEIVKESP